MKTLAHRILLTLVALFLLVSLGCNHTLFSAKQPKPRLSLFIGMDISGSFLRGSYFDDSIDFLAHYIYGHLHGLGGLEVPHSLFIGSIGGSSVGEAKTFYPKQTFEDKSVEEIAAKLRQLFPKNRSNPYTDYNAFFEQINRTVKNKNLILKPISVVMISDGIPDLNQQRKGENYKSLQVKPLENLARSVTLRLLYTDAVVGSKWQEQVLRRRVKVWTQDASVMVYWKDPKILIPNKPLEEQEKFFRWVNDNVDFGVRSRRVT